MAHGTPDWGLTAGMVTTHQLTDLAELAARLESVDRFDRRGDVIAVSSFEDGLAAFGTVISVGGSADLTAALVRSGAFAGRLRHDGSAGASAGLFLRTAYPVLSRFGGEISFNVDSTIQDIVFSLSLSDGTTEKFFTLKWVAATETLQVRNAAGAYVDLLTGVDLVGPGAGYQTIKLVADFSSDAWVRVLLNNRSAVPSVGSFAQAAAAIAPYLALALTATGNGGAAAGQVYTDDWIMTQNEPA